MAATFRRVVTQHDQAGRSIVRSIDTLTPSPIPSGDAAFQLVWTTPTVPVDLNPGDDGPTPAGLTLNGGSVIRIVDMLPGKASPMHRSFSIDYGIVLSGELELELDGGEVVRLAAGDIVVQRGTNHLWRNPSSEVCRIAFVLIEAKPVVVDGRVLEEVHPVTAPGRCILVTGAGGFIGRRLVQALLAAPESAADAIVLNDVRLADTPADPRIRAIEGDIAHPAVLAELLREPPDLIFHLAGILGGAAEQDYALARRVNIDATLVLMEAVRDPQAPPRFVFASSIAVFGPPLDKPVDDDTTPLPVMTYGAQKRMIEVAIEQFSARGWIDGVALRLPGIIARPGVGAALKSAFMSRLFQAFAAGDDIVLPVGPDSTTWLISVPACVEALLHAGTVPAARLGRRRAMTLPAMVVAFGDLVAALRAHFPDSRSTVGYDPDPAIVAQFGAQPPLTTALADSLGFAHDGKLAALVTRALSGTTG